MIWFARHLISAYAVRAENDPDLPDGLHLRIVPSSALGLPITPFLIYPLPMQRFRQFDMLEHEFIENDDGTRQIFVPDNIAGGEVIVAAEAFVHDTATERDWIAAFLNDGLRIATRRSVSPLIIAAPRLRKICLSPTVTNVTFYGTHPRNLEKLIVTDSPYEPLGLPIAAQLPWYSGGRGSHIGRARVELAAPKRMMPLDYPDGIPPQLSPDDEWTRLAAGAQDMDKLLAAMLGQDGQRPYEVLLEQKGIDENGVPQSVSSEVLSDVLLRATDPGMARYLGLSALLKDPGRYEGAGALPALGAVALFALSSTVRKQLDLIGAGPPAEQEGAAVIERFAKLFPGVEKVVDLAHRHGMWVGPISTVAAAPPPPDTPVIPSVAPQQGRWMTNTDGGAFAQGFVIARPPLAPLVALARMEGKWLPRNDLEASGRHTVRLVGIRTDPHPSSGLAAETQGLVFDQPIPGAKPPRYRFALGDLFGRYGPPGECDAAVPPRPIPPMPVVQISIRRAPSLPPAGNASPGMLHIRLPVPGLDDLALGALPIVTVRVSLGAAPHDEQVSSKTELLLDYPLLALAPQAVVELPLEIRFVNAAGTESEPYRETLRLADARAPKPIPSSYGLIWTSRPGPAKEVEIALRWPAPPGQQHRVYVADAAGLGLAGETRATIADKGVKQVLAGQMAGPEIRKCFRLLSDAPVQAGNDGQAVLRAGLPRALETVQFVRIVPISPSGVEADFDACGLVPVAVPADRAPPPPRLRLLPADGIAPMLRIEATGLNLDLLRQAEPGLFTHPPAAGAQAPEYRLRRVSGAVPDPIYAREIASGKLGFETAEGTTMAAATIADGAAPAPFVRYTYWAEIRMPPERRVLVNEQPVAGSASGVSPAQMAHYPSRWSPVSAPITVVNAPPQPPAAPAAGTVSATITLDAAGPRLDVRLSQAPLPGPGGNWHLRIWRGWGGAPMTQVADDHEILAAEVLWSETDPAGAGGATVGLALVDPLGRQGSVVTLAVPSST